MNRGELRSLLQLILNFNPGQNDQDFTPAQLNDALSRSYKHETGRARQQGGRDYFLAATTFTWPASQAELTLPANVKRRSLLRFEDISSGTEPGSLLLFSRDGSAGDLRWATRNSLRWGTSGPATEKTIRCIFFEEPLTLASDDDEPELIPDTWHELLAWSAAIELRRMADESAPEQWLLHQQELRHGLWKDASRGRPHDNIPTIEGTSSTGFLVL
jgi:hypothetical protein